jgi:hypothetical protein
MAEQKFEGWCVVELFGHQQIAGYVSEQVFGGGAFVRVDVPVTDHAEAHTKLFGEKAIYAIHPCAEEMAKQAAAGLARRSGATPLPVHVPDLSAARSTLEEARRAANWLKNQQAEIAAVLRQTAESETTRRLAAVSSGEPWNPGRDFEVLDGDDDRFDDADFDDDLRPVVP